MSVTVGYTADEVRELVHEYYLQPYGTRGAWLEARGVTRSRIRQWYLAVFVGDLDRGLVPREGGGVTNPAGMRVSRERQAARERAAHEAEVVRLNERIQQLEQVNDVLGKAIGLLHAMSEHEPDESPTPSDPLPSSPPSTPLSSS